LSRIILFNKPYGVICQFRPKTGQSTLADYIDFEGFYPAGRLDKDSEGLVLLTDDGRLQNRISDPKHKLAKVYRVEVEGHPTQQAIRQLTTGVMLNDGMTKPALVEEIGPPDLWPRDPPVRYRRHDPTSWLEITLSEGRNRQVRRMTAAVGYPTLRLVRVKIGHWSLAGLEPGQMRVEEVFLPLANTPATKTKKAKLIR